MLWGILQCEALEVLGETVLAVSLRTSLHTSIHELHKKHREYV